MSACIGVSAAGGGGGGSTKRNGGAQPRPCCRLHQLCPLLTKTHRHLQVYQQKTDTLAKTRILLEQRQQEVKEMERLFHRYTVDLQKQESMWALEDFACHVLCNHGLTQEERIAVLKKGQTLNATQLKIYQQQVSQLEMTVQELEPIPAKLTRTSQEYNTLLAEKTALLMESGEQIKTTLEASRTKNQNLQDHVTRIKETQAAGNRALGALSTVYSHLNSAANWGTYDMMGGGTFATMAKRGEMSKAKSAANMAQKSMVEFNSLMSNHLNSMTLQYDFDDMDGFSHVADYMFDGLLIDWHVQSQINTDRDNCFVAIGKVGHVLRELENRLQEAQCELTACRQVEEALVLSYGVDRQSC